LGSTGVILHGLQEAVEQPPEGLGLFRRTFFGGSQQRRGSRCRVMIEGLLQPMHLVVILAVALFFFGPKKSPDFGKGIAEGIRNFKSGIKEPEAEPSW
jgi:sec-independent protein translocase protein TatA